MSDLLSQIWSMMVGGLALAFFAGIAMRIWHKSGENWRRFSSAYPRPALGEPIARKATGAARVGQPGKSWGVYSGDTKANHLPPVWVSVYEHGLLLSVYGFLHHGQPDMFLPFKDMRLKPGKMGLIDCYGIQMRAVPDLEVLLYDSAIEWAATHSPTLDAMLKRAALGLDIFAGDERPVQDIGFGRRRRVRGAP